MPTVPSNLTYLPDFDEQNPDPRCGKFYCTVLSGCGRKFQRIAGPFATHIEALQALQTAKEIVVEHFPEACFASFGTIWEPPENSDRRTTLEILGYSPRGELFATA